MPKRLFLHIGQPKSGTTAVQRSFSAYSDSIERPAVYYPRSGRLQRKLVAHHNLAYELYAPGTFDAALGSWADLAEEISALAGRCDDVLLSSEAFRGFLAPVTAAKMRKHFADLEIRIILYLRPQWEYVESGYNQLLRFDRISDGINEFYAETGRRITDYQVIVTAWQRAFGPEALICLPFDAEVRAQGIVPHMLEHAFGRSDVKLPQGEQVNQKFGLLALSAVQYCVARYRALIGDETASLPNRTIMQLSHIFRNHPDERRDFTFMDAALRARIHADVIDMNRWLAEQFDGFDTPAFQDIPSGRDLMVVTDLPDLGPADRDMVEPVIAAALAGDRNLDVKEIVARLRIGA